MPRRYATTLTAMILLWSAVLMSGVAAQTAGSRAQTPASPSQASPATTPQQEAPVLSFAVSDAYTGKVVKTIHIETDLGNAKATSYAVVNEEK